MRLGVNGADREVKTMAGMKLRITTKGDWTKTENWLEKLKAQHNFKILDKYGREGVAALSAATPVDSGVTASSWSYRIVQNKGGVALIFDNSNKTKTNIPIAILIQYGHGNGRGAYIRGRDFINPITQPLFDKIVDNLWAETIK